MEPAKKMGNQESNDNAEPEVEISVDPGTTGRGRRRRSQPVRPEIPVNIDELRELIQLIREHEFTEFELEREGFRVRFRHGAAPVSETAGGGATASRTSEPSKDSPPATEGHIATAPAHPGAKAQTAASEDQDLYIIPSPIVGTFYRSPSPTADAFVKIGSPVEADTVVCIIEAMKLMNEIQAETSGEVAKIYVENGQPVEYGQPLFGIKK
ncbi:MAG: acetyl-CoA carboxylase biotin carboxyl carrier protein [Acidobacteriota bacterium]|nr:acetyl-CoA carboxylase biotin carboxyl carrier protein [Acidobacteriota bacterium]